MSPATALISALKRPRCRIPFGEPGPDGEGWRAAPLLPPMGPATVLACALPQTRVRALAGVRDLFVRFDCQVTDMAALRTPFARAAVSEQEHAWIELLPGNDPVHRWRVTGTFAAGATLVSHTQLVNGESSLEGIPDIWQRSVPTGEAGQDVQTLFGVERESWWVEFIVPWRALGLPERPVTIGFLFGRGFPVGADLQAMAYMSWPAPGVRTSPLPRNLECSEALVGPAAGAPEALELEPPRPGVNRGRLRLGDNWPVRPTRLRVRVETPDGASGFREAYPIAPDADRVEFAYPWDRVWMSHLDPFHPSALELAFQGVDEETVLYRARFPMDRHLGLCVDEAYGAPGLAAKRNAASGSLRDDWLDRVTGALPRLCRRTTAQGAVSDFCLCFEDGRLAVNLMADDPWRDLAALVTDRFSTAEDRLVAALALVGQKTVTNLVRDPLFFNAAGAVTYHMPLHEAMGPLSILRYGGGSAVCRAAVLAGLLQRITDPHTNRPFVTRVVSLTEKGGPRQVTRRYDGDAGLAPFVQQPGRVGAVAVDYNGSQTLLDPTGLAFFPAQARTLATVETIVADESLRLLGAGRLAPAYAKLDIVELRRQPSDQLLAKGVFPELAPDEAGEDRPFAPQVRQRIRVLRTFGGEHAARGFLDGWGRRAQREGAARVYADAAGLRGTVSVQGVDTRAFDARDHEAERVHVLIDPTHGHEQFFHFSAGLTGETGQWRESASGIQTLFKHLSTENHSETAALPDSAWTAKLVPRSGEGYDLEFAISWETLGLAAAVDCPPVIGFNIWIEGRYPHYEQVFLAPPRWRLPADPFSFADLILGSSDLEVREIDLDTPCWGDNLGRVVIVNRGLADAQVRVWTETRLSMRRCVRQPPATTVTVPAGGQTTAVFAYVADPEEKMTAGQNLALLLESAGRVWYRGQWRLTYCGPVSVFQRYGRDLGAAPNPTPGDVDFLRKKVDFICARIPVFQRLTTRDGAPSDFVVRAEDGSVQLNFMEPGILDRMAEYVTRLFEHDLDRVLGLFFLAHHPAVARHSSFGHHLMAGAGPLSLIRAFFAGGGGNCGPHSCVFSGMASRLRLAGAPLIAHNVTLSGHVISAVGWKGGKALMDADVGHFFLTRDGSDLATIDDLVSSAGFLSSAGPGDLGRYFTFQDNRVRLQRTTVCEAFEGVFPPGAPPV